MAKKKVATKKKPTATVKKEHFGKGNPKYKPEYCDLIVDMMGQGRSITQFAAKIDVTVKTIYNWGRKYEDFAYAIELGRTKAEACYETLGEHIIAGKVPPHGQTTFIYMTKVRFGWNDKPALSVDDVNDVAKAIREAARAGEDQLFGDGDEEGEKTENLDGLTPRKVPAGQ